jgi:serine phosphatase RsbU (regulator of sigma subunit)/anti-sigma regulatory factor (Ser/Thr protein kinase)
MNPPERSLTVATAEPGLGRLLELAVWLSGRLSFSRKYLLIGLVMLLTVGALSVPLWRSLANDRAASERARAGLAELQRGSELLAEAASLRDQTLRQATVPPVGGLESRLQVLSAPSGGTSASMPPALAQQLGDRVRLLASLPPDTTPAQRFGAFNGVMNALLAVLQASAQHHRLNIDSELDSTLAALTSRLPQVLDTLGRQRGALALGGAEFAPFALSAQVQLTEAVPALREALSQLGSVSPAANSLQPALETLLQGIAAQQDAADKMQDAPDTGRELDALAERNQVLTASFITALNAAADRRLADRVSGLRRSQWILAAVLVGALLAITFLFAGIYVSTMRSLNRLSQGTAAFCAGALDTRIRIETRDELVQVAGDFNTLATEFGRLLAVIREQNESRERELATQVAARTAELAEKNEQLSAAGLRVQEELALARDMQQALLPQQFPRGADWAVHARMQPARELGGDFYDVFSLPDGRLGMLVADVSGKGVAAAFFMAVSRTVLLDLASRGATPGEILAQANDLLCSRNPMDLFVTVCMIVYDIDSGELEYASAGHPPPLLRTRDGQVQRLPVNHDPALAVMPGMPYRAMLAQLLPGEVLLLYTDGITEAFSPAGEAFGDDRLQDWLAGREAELDPRSQVDALVHEVHTFAGDAEASDDITCLLLTRRADVSIARELPMVPMTNKVLLLHHVLPSRVGEIEPLAEAVTAALPTRPDLAFSANLCLEELVTNIINHGLRGEPDHTIDVRMSISDEWLEIVLKDDAPPFDPFTEASAPDLGLDLDERPIGGLGVHLVKTLMDDARAYYDGSGNLIVLLKTVRQPPVES